MTANLLLMKLRLRSGLYPCANRLPACLVCRACLLWLAYDHAVPDAPRFRKHSHTEPFLESGVPLNVYQQAQHRLNCSDFPVRNIYNDINFRLTRLISC